MAGASSIAAGAIVPMEGLFFDELSKIRVLDSEKQQETAELRNECKAFVDNIGKFQETVGSLIGTVLELSQAVETQKLKAIGARNLKQSLEQDRHAEKMQLEAQIGEKQAHLERLRIEHQALTKVQFEQEQLIERLVTQT